jgi:hypothetical protein
MIEELVDERGHDYGRAWFLESQFIKMMTEYHTNDVELPILYSDYSGPWGDVVKKLMRLAWSPEHVDSWADIEGYARLARRHIEDGVWHGETAEEWEAINGRLGPTFSSPRKKAKFTAQCTQTFSSVDVPDTSPDTEWRGTLERDGDGGLTIKDMVEVERARPLGDNIILGMATENVKAGDMVQIARKMEVRND